MRRVKFTHRVKTALGDYLCCGRVGRKEKIQSMETGTTYGQMTEVGWLATPVSAGVRLLSDLAGLTYDEPVYTSFACDHIVTELQRPIHAYVK